MVMEKFLSGSRVEYVGWRVMRIWSGRIARYLRRFMGV
jgi:hypothetical protein